LADGLRNDILGGAVQSGRLPTEAELCDAHGVSRMTVRKALDILAAEGMIERTPGRGTFVRRVHPVRLADARGMVAAINVSDATSVLNVVALQALGASEFFDRHGVHLSVKRNPHDTEEANALLANCRRSGVRGFLCYAHNDQTAADLADGFVRTGMPAVLLNTRRDDLRLDYVTCNNFAGGALAADYLIDLGHRRIAFMTIGNDVSLRDRWDGFCRRAHERGVEAATFATWSGCAMPMQEFLEQADRFTAVQCGYDKVAADLLLRLAERGLRVPDDMSVTGYDNCVAHCEHARVPITTIEQPAREMGRRAAQFLWERMIGLEPSAPRRVQLPPSLVVRSSAAAPRNSRSRT